MPEFAFPDGVRDFSTTTGTGTLSLLATASTGFRTFASAIVAGAFVSGNTVGYRLLHSGGGWECGVGVVTSGSPVTLSRVTVITSSNGNALVNFPAGTMQVDVVILGQAVFGVGKVGALATSFLGTPFDMSVTPTYSNVCDVALPVGTRRVIAHGNTEATNTNASVINRIYLQIVVRNAADSADVTTCFSGIGFHAPAFRGQCAYAGAIELATPTASGQKLRLRCTKETANGPYNLVSATMAVLAITE